ncbi:MAG: carbamoyl-phosphate synthase small subunit, partial [Acidobacteriota bacterium]|nr:carbamoyl-phosphate synthase small subunit [Acidobacteriota bacterium]
AAARTAVTILQAEGAAARQTRRDQERRAATLAASIGERERTLADLVRRRALLDQRRETDTAEQERAAASTAERTTRLDRLAAELADFPAMTGRALVDEVTCPARYELIPTESEERCHLAVYDFGVKRNILRSLTERGARLTVLPARTPASECRALGVDGVILSNGPGDPEPLTGIVEAVRELIGAGIPTFGICLGHQLLGLALGGSTFKLGFGHHGGNQPVHNLLTGRVTITSQNHGFAVDPASLPPSCRVTEVNLNDGTVEGFDVAGKPIFSVQYHPEAAPGPHDASPLFDRFLAAVGA